MPVTRYSKSRKAATTLPSGKLKKPETYVCTRCGTIFNKADHKKQFATVKSPLWENNEHKLPICNDCLKFYYDFYLRALGDPYSAYRRICMKFDMYYNDAIVDTILKNEQSADRIGAYISQLNYARHQDKTYDNTIEEENGKYLYGDCVYETTDDEGNPINIKVEYEKLKSQMSVRSETKQVEDEVEELPEYVAIFGEETGFKPREQKVMVKFYNEQMEQIPVQLATTLNETVKDLARFKILQARAINHDETKEITSYSTQFNNARKYIDGAVEKFKKNTAAEESAMVLGTTTELVENFCPASIWKSPEAFKDVDNLITNVLHRLVRPLKNFFSGSRELDPQFRLPD